LILEGETVSIFIEDEEVVQINYLQEQNFHDKLLKTDSTNCLSGCPILRLSRNIEIQDYIQSDSDSRYIQNKMRTLTDDSVIQRISRGEYFV